MQYEITRRNPILSKKKLYQPLNVTFFYIVLLVYIFQKITSIILKNLAFHIYYIVFNKVLWIILCQITDVKFCFKEKLFICTEKKNEISP